MSARSLGFGLLLGALLIAAGWPLLGCGHETIEPSPCGVHWPSYAGFGPGIIVGATTPNEDEYAFSCGGAGAPDWAYVWEPDLMGDYVLDTEGSGYDTVLGLMNEDCSMELACDDNGYRLSPGGLSQIIFHAELGQRYIIVVDGAGGEAGGFNIHVRRLGGSGP